MQIADQRLGLAQIGIEELAPALDALDALGDHAAYAIELGIVLGVGEFVPLPPERGVRVPDAYHHLEGVHLGGGGFGDGLAHFERAFQARHAGLPLLLFLRVGGGGGVPGRAELVAGPGQGIVGVGLLLARLFQFLVDFFQFLSGILEFLFEFFRQERGVLNRDGEFLLGECPRGEMKLNGLAQTERVVFKCIQGGLGRQPGDAGLIGLPLDPAEVRGGARAFQGLSRFALFPLRGLQPVVQFAEILLDHGQLVSGRLDRDIRREDLVAQFVHEIDGVRRGVLESLPGLDLRPQVRAGFAGSLQFLEHGDVALIGLEQGMEQGAALFDLVCVDPELLDGFRGVDGLRAFVVAARNVELPAQRVDLFVQGRFGLFRGGGAGGAVRPRQQVLQLLGQLTLRRPCASEEKEDGEQAGKNQRPPERRTGRRFLMRHA